MRLLRAAGSVGGIWDLGIEPKGALDRIARLGQSLRELNAATPEPQAGRGRRSDLGGLDGLVLGPALVAGHDDRSFLAWCCHLWTAAALQERSWICVTICRYGKCYSRQRPCDPAYSSRIPSVAREQRSLQARQEDRAQVAQASRFRWPRHRPDAGGTGEAPKSTEQPCWQ